MLINFAQEHFATVEQSCVLNHLQQQALASHKWNNILFGFLKFIITVRVRLFLITIRKFSFTKCFKFIGFHTIYFVQIEF